MLDRMGLSRKNGWADGQDRVYIYFTLDEVMHRLHCGREKAVKLIAELVNIDLIETKRQVGAGEHHLRQGFCILTDDVLPVPAHRQVSRNRGFPSQHR
jgi:hypothetical protein